MQKGIKIFSFASVLILLIITACSSGQQVSTTPQTGPGNNQGGPTISTEMKLMIGTLKLEGTDQAISVDEAKNLLPLWKAVKSISASNSSSTQEIQALFTQINDTMTPEQIQAIEKMGINAESMAQIMKDMGIQMGARPRTGTSEGTATANQGRQMGGPGGFPGGGFPGGGMPGGGMPGGGMPGGETRNQKTTPGATTNGQGQVVNTQLVEAIIQMLQKKVGSQ